MSDNSSNTNYVFTWKVLLFAVVVFIAIRILVRLIETTYHLGMTDLVQALITGAIGVSLTFLFARKKPANENGGS